ILAGFLLGLAHRQPDLAAAIDVEHLHVDLVALVQHVLDAADALVGDLRDVEQAVGPRHYLDEGAELDDLADRAVVDLADFGLGGDLLDHADRFFHRDPVGRRNQHGAVVLDVYFAAGLLDQSADDLAARA